MSDQQDFFTLHHGLDREGPGSDASTRRALGLLPDLEGPLTVLDLGCGPGAATVVLATDLPEAQVTAVDLHAPFVEEVRRRASAAGVADRVTAVVADMTDPSSLPGPVDLVWSEGAAYQMGFEQALATWRPLLRPGGTLVLSEPVWVAPTVTQVVSDFWTEAYPAMQPVQVRRAQAMAAGYRRIGDFTLPAADWQAYYAPIRDRLAELRHDPAMADVVAQHDREIAVFDGGGSTMVGYQMFVLRLPA